MQPAPGSLLIASATLLDPHFARCLLLVLDANDDGALAVILNQPTDNDLGVALPGWQDVASGPAVFFRGGPVEGNAALAIGALTDEPAEGWRSLSGPLGLVDLDSDPESWRGRLSALRVYAGYAGWGAGQLDEEIAEGSWHLAPAVHTDLFSQRPEVLWRQVLRRQPAPLSMLSTLPEDATLN